MIKAADESETFLGENSEHPSLNAFARKMRAYGPLSNADLKMLVNASEPARKVPAHHDLIREGAKPGPLFIILDGWACRYKILPDGSRQIMAFLLPGDFCDLHAGELEEMDHSIGTITPCMVSAVPREEIERLVGATPSLTRAFWRSQLIDQGTYRAWIVSIGRRSSIERVAHLMLELYIRMRNVGLATDEGCKVPLTQTTLADAVGLTPVHINRTLRALRERNAMKLGSKALKIINIAELAKIAGFDINYLHQRIRRTG